MRRLLALFVVLVSFLPIAPYTYAATPLDTVYVDPTAGATPLAALIASARHTIDGESYLLSSKPVLSALENAAAQGVVVRGDTQVLKQETAYRFRNRATHGPLSNNSVPQRGEHPRRQLA